MPPPTESCSLSTTYAGKTNDKRIADQEQIVYPGEAIK